MTIPRTSELPLSVDDRFDRHLTYAASLAAVLLFVPLLVPLAEGRLLTIDDLAAFHLPLRYLYQSALRAGQSVLWTSQLFSGFYIHGEGQVGALHPLHLLLYWALPLTFAFNLELVLSYLFAFAGMWKFLRHVGFATSSSIVGAIGFAFSGFALLHLPHMNAIAVVAHVPWLLFAIDLATSGQVRTRVKALIAISLLFGSQGLLGYPQYVWMSALICLSYGLVCGRNLLLRLIAAGVASIAGLMLAGIQLLPTLDLLSTSVRAAAGAEFAVSYSLHPLNIVQLLSPYLLAHRVYATPNERLIHEFGVYSGSLATIALVWAVLRRTKLPFARLGAFAGIMCLLGLLLAVGRYGILYQWLTFLPLVGKFRAPARHLMLVHLGFSILVAILFEDLRRSCLGVSPARRQLRWLWLPVLGSVATATLSVWYPELWRTFPDQPFFPVGMLIGMLSLGLAALLVRDAARGAGPALMVLPCVFALDLGLWGYSYIFASGMATVGELAGRAAPPPAEPGSTVHLASRTHELNDLVLHRFRLLRPYTGLIPPRALTLSTDAELRVSGAEWVSRADAWTRVPDAMPRVRFVPEWRVVDNPAMLSDIDVRHTALVTEDLPAMTRTTNPIDARATLVLDEPGRLVVDVSTSAPALLVTTEAYDRGWRATGASGAGRRTVRVYGDYLGIVAEAGDDRVSVVFRPDSMRRGIYASLTGVMLIAVLATVVSWKR